METMAAAGFVARLGLFMVAAFVLIILGLAGSHFFKRPLVGQGVPFRLHEAGSIFFALVHRSVIASTSTIRIAMLVVAVLLYAAGLGLFLWAQESIKKQPPFLAYSGVHPDTLYAEGPYALVRHPCYVAFILVWVAGAVATLNWWVAASSAVMTTSYVMAARGEEAAFARTRWAMEYGVYRTHVGMFVPRLSQLSQDGAMAVAVAVLAALGMFAVIVFDVLMGAEVP